MTEKSLARKFEKVKEGYRRPHFYEVLELGSSQNSPNNGDQPANRKNHQVYEEREEELQKNSENSFEEAQRIL